MAQTVEHQRIEITGGGGPGPPGPGGGRFKDSPRREMAGLSPRPWDFERPKIGNAREGPARLRQAPKGGRGKNLKCFF